MTTLFFDLDARDEFLEAADYYEKCRAGLGKIFVVMLRLLRKILLKHLSGSVSFMRLSAYVSFLNFHFQLSTLLNQIILELLLLPTQNVNLGIGYPE